MQKKGKVSIIVPCFNVPAKYFEPLLSSVFAQGYADWELILVDASSSAAAKKYLRSKSEHDVRIVYHSIENRGIAANTNYGIGKATGDYIAFLDHDDTLDANALARSVRLLSEDPELSLVYSDEDKISEDGERYFEPLFKPDFSIDMLRNVNYITHFVVARKQLVNKIGGIRLGFDGAQDYDFLLRVVDENVGIGHIPEILYHWREAENSTATNFSNKSYVTEAGVKALNDHFTRNQLTAAKAYAIANRPGYYGAHYTLDKSIERSVYVDFTGLDMTEKEKQYVLDCYRNNRDVIANKITVDDKRPPTGTALEVRGCVVPLSNNTDISSLFGLAEEEGVVAVAPAIMRQARVCDMGYVGHGSNRTALFKGLNPLFDTPFGPLEWVRNVDRLSGLAVATKHKPKPMTTKNNSRHVVWTHSKFTAIVGLEPGSSLAKPNYFNPNIRQLGEYGVFYEDYPEDLVEISK